MESPDLTFSALILMTSNVIGGLCIFLLGMKYLSDGVQAVAGSKMRKMISPVTDNRLAACGTGLCHISNTVKFRDYSDAYWSGECGSHDSSAINWSHNRWI